MVHCLPEIQIQLGILFCFVFPVSNPHGLLSLCRGSLLQRLSGRPSLDLLCNFQLPSCTPVFVTLHLFIFVLGIHNHLVKYII